MEFIATLTFLVLFIGFIVLVSAVLGIAKDLRELRKQVGELQAVSRVVDGAVDVNERMESFVRVGA